MHLRAVKLRGFKSFPDPVEIRLEPGVGVIVGPNGSGKSNVSDAIRWAAGSLSPTELRAEKPDDVLFAGGGSRGPADFCEVELLFDNADGALPVDYAELSVTRRLHRGGEGQYLVNRAAVRRLDLVELLADLGLGQGMHSIISQGKVEAILASRPAERRALIEEAAGLGPLQGSPAPRRAEARTGRARGRARPRRRGGGQEAPPAARAPGDRGRAGAEARRRDRPPARAYRAARPRRPRRPARGARGAAQRRREWATWGGGEARGAARRAHRRPRRSSPTRQARASRRCRCSTGSAARRSDSTCGASPQSSALQRLRDELERPRRVLDGRVRAEREALTEQIRLLEERLRALDRTLAEREGLPPAARALAEEGERIALSLLEVEPGRERAVAAALGRRASAVIRDDAAGALELLERARAGGLGSLVVLVGTDPARLVAEMPVVAKEELLASPVAAVTAGRLRVRPGERRALVRGRDGRGAAARAPGAPAGARRRAGRAAAPPRGAYPRQPPIRSSRIRFSFAARRSRSGSSARSTSRRRTSRRRCAGRSKPAPRAAASSAPSSAGSARPRSSCGRSSRQRPKPSRRSRSRPRGSRPRPTRRVAGSNRPMRTSRRRATTASSSSRPPSGSSAAARRSARSTRSRTRSTRPRRCGSRSSPRSGPTSRRASRSSRSSATS